MQNRVGRRSSFMSSLARPELAELTEFGSGLDAHVLAQSLGLPGVALLSTNEIPYGPCASVVESLRGAVLSVNRYPDIQAVRLRRALADRYEVDLQRVATGCGSAALLEFLIRATCRPGEQVLFGWRSYEAYPTMVLGAGAAPIAIPNTEAYEYDCDKILSAITPSTRLIIFCNPNNPTGTAIRRKQLDDFVEQIPPDTLLVFDEAYREFVTDDDVPDALETYGRLPNVAVLRTMSKAWGLAGLRCGWMVASPEIASVVRKVMTPFSTGSLAQVAALAALTAEPEIRHRIDLVVRERQRIYPALLRHVPATPPSESNCHWLPVVNPSSLVTLCESRGVIVKAFPDGVRVTIGRPEENDMFLAVLDEFVVQEPSLITHKQAGRG
jgi:histidinol-phosphate aminotransferase